MMNRGVRAAIVTFSIGIIVVISGFFLLEIERAAIHYCAFGSLLLSLGVALFSTVFLLSAKNNDKSVFFPAGLGSAIWVYVISVLVSVFFTRAFLFNLGGFVFLQIVIHALYFIAAITIIIIAPHLRGKDLAAGENQENGEYNKPKRGGF